MSWSMKKMRLYVLEYLISVEFDHIMKYRIVMETADDERSILFWFFSISLNRVSYLNTLYSYNCWSPLQLQVLFIIISCNFSNLIKSINVRECKAISVNRFLFSFPLLFSFIYVYRINLNESFWMHCV